jgi:hypothetical protein
VAQHQTFADVSMRLLLLGIWMLSLGTILVATGTRVLCDVARAEGMLTYYSGAGA